MSLPPIIGLSGTPTCPQGYGYDPASGMCVPITAPIKVDVTGTAQQEVDPSQFARQAAGGYKSSGILFDFVTALWTWLARHAATIVSVCANVFDLFLAALAQFFFAAQGQRNPGYFQLVAALMTDLTGINVDGQKMYNDFQSKGRLQAMRDLGGALINALASEFAGVQQVTAGEAWTVTPGTGVGGLPAVQLTPAGGVDAARAFMGFMTSFAVREGNTDLLADYLPYGLGAWFKDFAEDFSKSVGIGRLGRVAFRPLIQHMVADPLGWALNMQYRPKLLAVTDAIAAWKTGVLSDTDLDNELAMLGYSDIRQRAMKGHRSKPLAFREYRTGLTGGLIDVPTMASRLGAEGYDLPTVEGWNLVADLDPARAVTLRYVEHYVTQFLEGHITPAAAISFLDTLSAQLSTGKVPLTANEILHLRDLVTTIQAAGATLRPRHLTVAQLQLAYIDGTITLQDFEDHLAHIGYTPDDVTILTIETLVKAKDKAATAAAKAAKQKTGAAKPGSAASGTGG